MAQKSEALPNPAPIATPLWRSVWVPILIRRPSVATFETLTHETKASSTTACLWIFVSSSISITLLAAGLIFCYGWAVTLRDLLWLLLFEVPIASLMAVLIFILSTRVTQLMAKAVCGTGAYPKLAFSIAAFSAPLALIFSASSALVMDVFSRIVSPTVAGLLVLPLVLLCGVYGFVLNVIAVKTVNQLEWSKAIIASIVGAFTLVIGAVIALVILLILDYFDIFRWYMLSIILMLPIIPLCIVAFISAIRWRKLRLSVLEDGISKVVSSFSDDRTLEQRARRARRKWSRAESSSFVDSTSKALVRPETKKSKLAPQLLEFEVWEERFQSAFYNLLKELRQNQDEIEWSIAENLNGLYTQAAELLTNKTYDLALEVLETGELHSVLVKIDNVVVYILFFPGLHDQPSLLKRYKSFSKGWVSHIEQMRTLLPSEAEQFALAELALFLTPNLRQGVMHLAFQDKQNQILPVGLLDDSEVKNAKGRLCELRQVI
jgi:hypothetical protein